jgi:hypothetical protein
VLEALENKYAGPIDSMRVPAYLGWDLSEVIPVEREPNTWDELRSGVRRLI